jgi:DNA-binding MarR family transcriptional regulator
MRKETSEILALSEKLISELVAREKRPHLLPDGSKVYRFELHIIDLIGKNRGITVNELAQALKVTKGAVSQVITKLEKEGAVEKVRNENNRKNVNLYLTPKGEKVFEGHKRFHDNINSKLDAYFEKYSLRETDMIKSLLLEISGLFADN